MKISYNRSIKIAGCLSALFFASCDKDLLQTLPTDRLSENIFWKTTADAELAVNALYTDLEGTETFMYDALTDIAHVNQPFEVDAFIEVGTYDASSSRVLNVWTQAYKGIGAVNYFLANIDRVPVGEDAAILARYRAEARVLRAYHYIRLLTLFGEVPLVTSPQSLEEGRLVKRTPKDAIYDFIDAELHAAATDLPEKYTSTNLGRITKWTALALKARANLYGGRYTAAAQAAKAIIDGGQFDLYASYATLFSYEAENNKEVILDKQFLENTFVQNAFHLLAPYSVQSAQSTYVPTKAFVDQFETTEGRLITDPSSGYNPNDPYANRDPRLGYSVFLAGDILPNGKVFHPAPNSGTADAVGSTYVASTTGFNVKKYVDKKDYANPKNSGLNIILIRYAEILLTYAEAKVELGQLDQSVIDAINKIRNGRNDVKMPALPLSTNSASLRQFIRRERTVELAFEGLHLADIRRWKTAEAVVPGKVYGISYLGKNGQTQVVQVAVESRIFDAKRHYLWPVPQQELDLNKNLTQNPNW